ALKAQGFGVLTEIDMRATLRDKLGEDMEDYLILGACNPSLAHRALGIDSSLGLLLPCNVVVRSEAGQTIVEALDPQTMVTITGQPALQPVADEAAGRLRAALDSLRRAAEHAGASRLGVPAAGRAGKPAPCSETGGAGADSMGCLDLAGKAHRVLAP
ncbi:MAG: DUF302 domain-containing protein, partial [Streptosporangiaceae bacterium]